MACQEKSLRYKPPGWQRQTTKQCHFKSETNAVTQNPQCAFTMYTCSKNNMFVRKIKFEQNWKLRKVFAVGG